MTEHDNPVVHDYPMSFMATLIWYISYSFCCKRMYEDLQNWTDMS